MAVAWREVLRVEISLNKNKEFEILQQKSIPVQGGSEFNNTEILHIIVFQN